MRYHKRITTHIAAVSLTTGYERNKLTLKGRYVIQYGFNIYDLFVGTRVVLTVRPYLSVTHNEGEGLNQTTSIRYWFLHLSLYTYSEVLCGRDDRTHPRGKCRQGL